MNNKFSYSWNLLSKAQKIQLIEDLWERYSGSQESKLLLAKIWELLEDSRQKEELWELLKDPQREGLWELLKDHQREGLWKLLNDEQRVILLEILSRPYSLSHIVFSMRSVIESKLKNDKKLKEYNLTNVYMSLEEDDGTLKQNKRKAAVFTRIKDSTLYIGIRYDAHGDIVEYDGDARISKQCSRFFVGHEVAHIMLDIYNIVKNSVEGKQLQTISATAEVAADFFAYMLSDLRDLHILKRTGTLNLPSEDVVAKAYQKEMREQGVDDSDNVIDLVLNLNQEAKKFTMSNSIFATKKIMNIIYGDGQRKISLIYPTKNVRNEENIVQIECFKPQLGNEISFGYAIFLSNSLNLETDSCGIAKAIGALLLDYDTIKKKESEQLPCRISIDKKFFSAECLRNFQNFAECLSRTRRNHLNDFAASKIKSQNRILNIKQQMEDNMIAGNNK